MTYLANSREGLARGSGAANSSPVAEDDRDLLVSGLLGAEVFSLTVNSQDRGRAVLCSCCLLMRRDTSDCFRS